jgi:hypothetical protein
MQIEETNLMEMQRFASQNSYPAAIVWSFGDIAHHIREPEIAECSKNARICNILLEIFHIFFIFHKKN